MIGDFKAGNYRLINGDEICFYKVYRSTSIGWCILDIPDGDLTRIDKKSRRPLTNQEWEMLEFWQ